MLEEGKSSLGGAVRAVHPGCGRTGTRARRRRIGSWGLAAAVAALALAPVAQAETTSYTISETVPITMTTDNPCTGEPVVLSGTYHFTSRYSTTTDLTGTKLHSVEMKKLSMSGTSALTGARYQNEQQELTEQNWTFTFESGALAPYERTDEATMLLIRQGETTRKDDFHVRFVSHITYSASGIVNVKPGELQVFCR